jgi:hypothetical protein
VRLALHTLLLTTMLMTSLGTHAQELDSFFEGANKTGRPQERGGVVTGGGSSVILPDGTMRLADFAYQGPPISQLTEIKDIRFYDFPKEIVNYTWSIFAFLKKMGVSNAENFFIHSIVAKGQTPYLLVPAGREDNVPCRKALPKVKGAVKKHFQYACTFRGDTYILTEQWKVDPKDKQNSPPVSHLAFRIVHERMWAAFPNADQADISAFAGGLEVFMEMYELQRNGSRPAWTASLQKAVEDFYIAAKKFGFVGKEGIDKLVAKNQFKVLPEGGVIFGCADQVSVKNSYISFGTKIVKQCDQSTLQISDSVIVDSFIRVTTAGSFSINDSQLQNAELRNTTVQKSRITKSYLFESTVIDSTVKNSEKVGPARIVRSSLDKVISLKGNNANRPSELLVESSDLVGTQINADAVIGTTDIATAHSNANDNIITSDDQTLSPRLAGTFQLLSGQSQLCHSRFIIDRVSLAGQQRAVVTFGTLIMDVFADAKTPRTYKAEFQAYFDDVGSCQMQDASGRRWDPQSPKQCTSKDDASEFIASHSNTRYADVLPTHFQLMIRKSSEPGLYEISIKEKGVGPVCLYRKISQTGSWPDLRYNIEAR